MTPGLRRMRSVPSSIQYLMLQLNGYSLALLGVSLTASVLFLLIWPRRLESGAQSVAGLLLALALWSGAYGLELASLDQESMLFWVRIEYPGIVAVPVLWLLF